MLNLQSYSFKKNVLNEWNKYDMETTHTLSNKYSGSETCLFYMGEKK